MIAVLTERECAIVQSSWNPLQRQAVGESVSLDAIKHALHQLEEIVTSTDQEATNGNRSAARDRVSKRSPAPTVGPARWQTKTLPTGYTVDSGPEPEERTSIRSADTEPISIL